MHINTFFMIDCKDIACLQRFKRSAFSRNLIQATRCLNTINNYETEFLDVYNTCFLYRKKSFIYYFTWKNFYHFEQ